MKILHVIDRIGLQYGGSAEVCRKQTKALQVAGHDVTLFSSDIGLDGYIPEAAGLKTFDAPVNFYRSFHITPKMISQDFKKFDVIHIHNYITFQNLVAVLKAGNVPIVWQPHGSLVAHRPEYQARMYSPMGIAKFVYSNLLKRRVAGIIAVSDQERDQALDMVNASKVGVIPNGIDLDDYKDLPERGKFRKQYGIPGNAKMVLYIGRKDWTKNVDGLIEAYELGIKSIENTYLVLIGVDDTYRQDGNVITTPQQFGENKISAYVDADLLVLPSRYEIFGLTPLEALACGTRVLVSNKAGISRLIGNNPVLGGICEPDIVEIATSVGGIITAPDTPEQMIARQEVARLYDWNNIILSVVKYYESCR